MNILTHLQEQNAFTSADETVYFLEIPTDDADLGHLRTAFSVLAQFAAGIRSPPPCESNFRMHLFGDSPNHYFKLQAGMQ